MKPGLMSSKKIWGKKRKGKKEENENVQGVSVPFKPKNYLTNILLSVHAWTSEANM